MQPAYTSAVEHASVKSPQTRTARFPIHSKMLTAILLCAIYGLSLFSGFCGDAHARMTIEPRLIVSGIYTDNVDLSAEETEWEYITTINPGMTLNWEGRNKALALSYDPVFAAYHRFPEYDNLRHSARLDAWTDIADRTRLTLTNAFLETEEPFTEEDITARRSRQRYFTNTAAIEVRNEFGVDNAAAVRYEYALLENDDPTVEDSTRHRPSALLTYWLTPNRWGTELEAIYTRGLFDTTDNFNEWIGRARLTRRFTRNFDAYLAYVHTHMDFDTSAEEDYRVYNPIIGFIWAESPNSSLRASFGYFYQDNSESEDDDGFTAGVATTYTPVQGTTLTLTGDTGYEQTYFGVENLGFNQFFAVTGSVAHQLSRRVATTLHAGYRRVIYTTEDPDREDTGWTAGGSLSFQALPWMAVMLDYRYREIDSNIDINDYKENRVILSVALTPRQPLLIRR